MYIFQLKHFHSYFKCQDCVAISPCMVAYHCILNDILQIISNTTISRPDAVIGLPHADEMGGLSGKPLFKLSTDVLKEMYQLTRVSILI